MQFLYVYTRNTICRMIKYKMNFKASYLEFNFVGRIAWYILTFNNKCYPKNSYKFNHILRNYVKNIVVNSF